MCQKDIIIFSGFLDFILISVANQYLLVVINSELYVDMVGPTKSHLESEDGEEQDGVLHDGNLLTLPSFCGDWLLLSSCLHCKLS